jgi:hypothetical protein
MNPDKMVQAAGMIAAWITDSTNMERPACRCGFALGRAESSNKYYTFQAFDYYGVVRAEITINEIQEFCKGADVDDPPDVDDSSKNREGDWRTRNWNKAKKRIADARGFLYVCPECGRLIWRKPGDDRCLYFVPERGV